uniref:Uncharacterized protein n=1 Tax=Globodera rostochiensis TaxID=31243 RepID=A0A914HVY7_GLORO
MAASVAGSGRGASKKHGTTGGSRNAQRQEEGAQQNNQTKSKTENVGTSQNNAKTTNVELVQPKTVAERNELALSAEVVSFGWETWTGETKSTD